MELLRVKTRWRTKGGVTVAAALAVLLTLGVPQYVPEAAEPAATPTPVASKADAEALAQAEASETGRPVEVLAKRSEVSQVFANPDGTFTQDTYALPSSYARTASWCRSTPRSR
ncbi:hypothetical protein SMICM304S_07515 [Streptomyces microflavus]